MYSIPGIATVVRVAGYLVREKGDRTGPLPEAEWARAVCRVAHGRATTGAAAVGLRVPQGPPKGTRTGWGRRRLFGRRRLSQDRDGKRQRCGLSGEVCSSSCSAPTCSPSGVTVPTLRETPWPPLRLCIRRLYQFARVVAPLPSRRQPLAGRSRSSHTHRTSAPVRRRPSTVASGR